MSYIKREDAIKAILDLPNCYNGFSDTYDKERIISTIEEVPSVDVVHCGDCKYWESDGGAMMYCEITDIATNEHDYCSMGKKDETD